MITDRVAAAPVDRKASIKPGALLTAAPAKAGAHPSAPETSEAWVPAFAGTSVSCALNRRQGPPDIGHQIGLALEPGRQPHQRVADAEHLALLGLQPRMRRGRRMGDQALRIPEIVRDVDELQRIQ